MKIPRWVHKIYALRMGYFWLPCPLCGKEFGGHEWDGSNCVKTSWSRGRGVCDDCVDIARSYNEAWREKYRDYTFSEDRSRDIDHELLIQVLNTEATK